jgi:hypothetical protein
MKRLISKKDKQPIIEKEPKDEWLGKEIEVINPDSKFYGFRGIVDRIKNEKYILKIDAAPYENTDKPHVLYFPKDKDYKWMRLLPQE